MKRMHLILLSSLILLACLLPGMIPLPSDADVNSTREALPEMETDSEKVISALNNQGVVTLRELAKETYAEEDFAKPGIVTFTATVTNEKPVYFSYGWCTVDQQTLEQNFEHISILLYLNGEVISEDNVHILSFELPDGSLVCADFGVLLSNWEAGEYELKSVVMFDETINDGLADYEAGDYVQVYAVTVEE